MYLFVYVTGQVRQVHDNVTVADLLALQQKTLKIFQCSTEGYLQAVIDNGKLVFVPVPEANVLKYEDGRIHHP